jgi:hypothetical protein
MSTRVTIRDIAAFLHALQGRNQRTVLFLGSRVSKFWRNAELYKTISGFSNNNFYHKNEEEKFRDCFEILGDRKRFNERDVHQLLIESLTDNKLREEDICLAELLKAGFFDVLCSTCIDGFVESVCEQAGLDEDRGDLSIWNPLSGKPFNRARPLAGGLIVVRAFGDLEFRCYATAGNELKLDEHPERGGVASLIEDREGAWTGYYTHPGATLPH